MRAAGAGAGAAGTASLPGTVTATLAAARSSAAQLSSSGGWGSHRHGSVSYWGEGSLMTATPPRPGSPLGMGLPSLSPTGSRPGSPLLQLGISAAGVEAAGGALGSKENAYSRGRGVGSLVSLSGGVLVSAPAGAQLGAAAARDVSSSITRAGSIPVEKAVCFITPRTQAAAAAAAAAGACSVTQVQRSSHVAAAAQSAALQRLHEGAAQHSVQLATGPAAHTAAPRQSSCSSTGGASSCMEDTSGAGGPSQQQQQQKVTEEQQRRLVHAACKALGSAAAAEAYAASLPEDTLVANFSASGTGASWDLCIVKGWAWQAGGRLSSKRMVQLPPSGQHTCTIQGQQLHVPPLVHLLSHKSKRMGVTHTPAALDPVQALARPVCLSTCC